MNERANGAYKSAPGPRADAATEQFRNGAPNLADALVLRLCERADELGFPKAEAEEFKRAAKSASPHKLLQLANRLGVNLPEGAEFFSSGEPS